MELKPGYKQTEVGVIPEDWDSKPLQGKISIAHGFAFSSQYFTSHGLYRLTTPGHFYENGGFRDIGEKQKYYNGPVPNDYLLRPGDLIVAMTEQADGLLGSAALIPQVDGYLHNQRLGRVRALSSEVELAFLFYLFNSPDYRAKVRETAAGTKVKHTSPQKLLEIYVRLPLPPEQRAIAEALSDVDAVIDALTQLIAKKRDLKQAAMQQLLTGHQHLPGFHGEWEVKRLDAVADIQRGASPRPIDSPVWYDSASTVGWVRISDLTGSDGKNLFATRDYLSAKGIAHSRFLPSGSLIMSICATVGMPVITRFNTCIYDGFVGFTRLRTVDQTFLYYKLKELEASFKSMGQTGSQSNLNSDLVRGCKVAFPLIPEQTAIAEVLSDMDAELAAIEQRLAKTRDLKQGMMQELLTGRTRLV